VKCRESLIIGKFRGSPAWLGLAFGGRKGPDSIGKIGIAEVLRLRATSAVSFVKSVRRSAQDDNFVGIFDKGRALLGGENGGQDIYCIHSGGMAIASPFSPSCRPYHARGIQTPQHFLSILNQMASSIAGCLLVFKEPLFRRETVKNPLKKIQTATREEKAILLEPSFDHKHQALAQRKHHRLRHLV
jgi:hypothetical protein